MNRYAFYVLWSNILTVGSLFSVAYLIENRFNGSILAIALCTIPGSIYLVTLIKSLRYFPKQGLPEIFRMFMHAWGRVPLLIFFSFMIISKGCLMIGYTASVINQYLLPEISPITFIAFFFLAAAWGATRSSKTILSTLELVIILTTPFIYFVSIKSIFSHGFEWNAVRAMSDYIFILPKWHAITTANIIFSGFMGLTIFNRTIPSRINGKFYALILFLSLHFVCILFMISIGYHGTIGVGNYINPGLSAIDDMYIELGLFQRGLLLYLLTLILLFIMYATITFHVGIELVKGCFSMDTQNKPHKERLVSWVTITLYAILTMLFYYFFSIKEIYNYTITWLNVRFFTELLMVVILVVLAGMKRRRSL